MLRAARPRGSRPMTAPAGTKNAGALRLRPVLVRSA